VNRNLEHVRLTLDVLHFRARTPVARPLRQGAGGRLHSRLGGSTTAAPAAQTTGAEEASSQEATLEAAAAPAAPAEEAAAPDTSEVLCQTVKVGSLDSSF
jgi:hypothetical protein